MARDLVLFWRRGGHEPQLGIWLAERNHVDERIHRLPDALGADLAHHWTQKERAQQAAMSECQLRRRFSALTDLSLADHLARRRLQRARQLVSKTDGGLMRIAENCGNGEYRQLRRVWERFENGSPAAWRRSRER